jgi:hypothetical protein
MKPFRPQFRQVLRPTVLFLLVTVALGAWAQGGFVINGRLKIEGGSVSGARMVVYRQGIEVRTVTQDLRKFTLPLDLNMNYVLSFEKDGFVTKKLSFNTQAPAAAVAGGLAPFEFVVSLFKQYDGVNTVVFNQPVGMIRFDNVLGDFGYDTDYTKSIQGALKDVQEAVAKKQAEDREKRTRTEPVGKDAVKAPVAKGTNGPGPDKPGAEAPRKQPEAKVAAAIPPPAIEPPRKPISAHTNISIPTVGKDLRRTAGPVRGVESSRVEAANAHVAFEPRPKYRPEANGPVRHEQLLVEPNQVITVVRLEKPDGSIEYRKVVRKYSGTFYFKDGTSCSEFTYESEALAESGR